jgi:hypothetical protein
VIWGGLHGVCLILERTFVRLARPSLWLGEAISRVLGWSWTISVVLVGWAFFRAASLPNALAVVRSMSDFGGLSYGTFKMFGFASFEIAMLAVSLLILFTIDYLISFRPALLTRLGQIPSMSTALGLALTYYVVLFGIFGRVEFIYFQF